MAELIEVDIESEMLRNQMEESREALSQKIEMLEEKVAETVQTATDSVTEATSNVLETVQTARESVSETVDSVTNAVQGTVDTVCQSVEGTVDSMKNAINLTHQVEQHPWLMMGGAVAAGFLTAKLLENGRSSTRNRPLTSSNSSSPSPQQASTNIPFSHPSSIPMAKSDMCAANPNVQEPTWLENIAEMFGSEINQLERLAVGVALASVRDIVVEITPPSIQKPLKDVFDNFTEKMGGQRISGQILNGHGSSSEGVEFASDSSS